MSDKTTQARHITERDRRVIRLLFENKVATFSQLKAECFPNVCLQMAYRRIGQLEASGFIKRHGFVDQRILKSVFGITEKSYNAYVLEKDINDRSKQLSSEVPAHDLVLVDIRRRFERLPVVKQFYPENVIQSYYSVADSDEFKDFAALRSDAAVELILQEKFRYVLPVEYEATLKSKERNEQKLLDYYVKCDGNAVLFICKNATIQKALSKIDQEISKDLKPKLYFISLSDVLSDAEHLTFVSSSKDKHIVL